MNVYTSSVIMSVLSAVISPDLPERIGEFVAYAFLRPNYPEELTNLFYFGFVYLPLGQLDSLTRLQMCDDVLHEFKYSQLPKYIEFIFEQAAVFPNIVKEWLMPHQRFLTPVRITNMSVDREGIQIGGFECSSISVSAGVYRERGLRFMALGYKDQLQISVSANSSAFDEIKAQKFAIQVYEECKPFMLSL